MGLEILKCNIIVVVKYERGTVGFTQHKFSGGKKINETIVSIPEFPNVIVHKSEHQDTDGYENENVTHKTETDGEENER
jgi:hypothetical protein